MALFLLTRPSRDVTDGAPPGLYSGQFLLTRPSRDVTAGKVKGGYAFIISTHTSLAGRDCADIGLIRR